MDCPHVDFHLVYRGRLLTQGARSAKANKQEIRRAFHPQIAELFRMPGMPSNLPQWSPREVGEFSFVPLAPKGLHLVAEFDVLFLRPGQPGDLLQSGDIDNRMKTLLDALRMPHTVDEVPRGDQPADGEVPFYCLLEDDALVTRLNIDTDTLLTPSKGNSEVELVIKGRIYATAVVWAITGSPLGQR